MLQRQIHHWAIQNSDPHLGYFPHNGVFRHSLLQATLFVAKGNGPKTPSIQVVTVWSFYSKKKDSCSFQCHVWKIPKISGYQSAIGQSQQLCANFATSSLVKNSHTPSLANMKWPEPSSSSCAAKKKSLKLSQFQPVEDRSDNGLLQLENLRLSDDTVAFVPGRICQ